MRRTVTLVLALPLLAGLAACGGGSTSTGTDTASVSATDTGTPSSSPETSDPGSPTTSPDESTSTSSTATSTGSSTSGTSGAAGIGGTFAALGTEPFWNVAVTGGSLLYTQVDQPERALTGTRTDEPDEVKIAGTKDGVEFTLEVERASCSDGMSDIRYDWTAEFHYGEVELRGCAKTVG